MGKSNARYALLGCLLLLLSSFSTYLLHLKVGLEHNNNLRITQIVAADTAWAGKMLVDFAREIDEDFFQLGGFNNDPPHVLPPSPAIEPSQVKTTANAPHHVTTNGPLRVAPGIVWVIPAYKRAWTLDLVLKSLQDAGASASTVVVSQDADSQEIRDVANQYLKSGALPKLRLVSHPWSCSRHPHSFPGDDPSLNVGFKGDTYGNPRSPWATCLKHHWWWLMNFVWSSGADTVCLLEDDIVIRSGTLEWIKAHSQHLDQDFGIKLSTSQIAVPWCMGRKVWDRVHAAAEEFCSHDDYNWDQTLAWMLSKGSTLKTNGKVLVPRSSLAMHVGSCEGWDSGGRDTKCTPKQINHLRVRRCGMWYF